MPTYHARGISIRMGAAPLTPTITPNFVLRKGNTATEQCKEAEQRLLKSSLLSEQHVSFPGDDRDFKLNWLGGAPFMQAQIGHDLSQVVDSDSDVQLAHTGTPVFAAQVQRQPEPNGTDGDWSDPLALSLHVALSEKLFFSGLDKDDLLHLKIEVFFNGQISACLLLPYYEIRSGAKALHQVFAGYRIDYLAERPWIILPPQVKADGSPSKSQSFTSAEQRWSDICKALNREVGARGSNEHGQIPPSAEFLKALVGMQMPSQVRSMQKPGSKNFGVVDVVITAGTGKKLTAGTSYLKAPQRFIDENFPLRVIPNGSKEALPTVEIDATLEDEAPDDLAPNAHPTIPEEELEIDQELEPKPKRRASSRQVLPIHHESKICLTLLSGTRCNDTEISTTPTPLQHMLDKLPYTPPDSSSMLMQDNTHLATLQGFPSFPSSDVRLEREPQIRPSSRSLPYSDPLLEQELPKASMRSTVLDHANAPSSPLGQIQQNQNKSLRPLLPVSSTQNSEQSHVPNSSDSSITCPEPPRRGSLASASSSSLATHRYQYWPNPHFHAQQCEALQAPSHVPNMLPSPSFSSNLPGSMFGALPYPPPYDRRYSLPLPPTGLFSVPTKPRSGSSLRKKPLPAVPEIPQQDLHVYDGGQGVGDPIQTTALSNAFESTAYTDATLGQRPSALSYQTKLPKADVSLQCQEAAEISSCEPTAYGTSSSSTKQSESTQSQRCLDAEPKDTVTVDKIAKEDPDAPSREPDMGTPDSLRPAMPRRRTTSSTGGFGVQGPKATTVWLDNPEEMLREDRKTRQSKTPLKRKRKEPTAKLSSSPAKPQPLDGAHLCAPQNTASVVTKVAETGPPAQVDGSPESELVALSPQKPDLHSLEHDGASTAKNLPEALSLSKSVPVSSTQKLKSTTGSLARQPRSPDRLKTVSNPPLNQDCVIAFAESKDKECKRGVLRQVRGERQGVFMEEYVLLATRFFVAGN